MAYRKNKQRVYDDLGTLISKDCPRCRKLLPVAEYNACKSCPDELSSLCRPCTKKFADARESPDTRRRLLLSRVKTSAKKQGLPFDLTLDDIIVPTHCPVLGIPLVFGKATTDASWRDNSPSLDRIIPARGYVKGNVVVVSYRVNRIKNDSTVTELQTIADFYTELTKAQDEGTIPSS